MHKYLISLVLIFQLFSFSSFAQSPDFVTKLNDIPWKETPEVVMEMFSSSKCKHDRDQRGEYDLNVAMVCDPILFFGSDTSLHFTFRKINNKEQLISIRNNYVSKKKSHKGNVIFTEAKENRVAKLEAIITELYGEPYKKVDDSIKNYDRYKLLWKTPKTIIEINLFYTWPVLRKTGYLTYNFRMYVNEDNFFSIERWENNHIQKNYGVIKYGNYYN